MSETLNYNYVFQDGSTSISLSLAVAPTPTDSTGVGSGYAIQSITGSVGADSITGQVGTGGAVQTDVPYGYKFANTVFLDNSQGFSGSSNGIDEFGIEFTAGGNQYNLYYLDGAFHLLKDEPNVYVSTAGDLIQLVSTNAPCYCAGTLIQTDRGDVRVETLAIGDMVATAGGELRRVEWIGSRSYAGRFLAANPGVQPVRFRAGSLGEGLPRRDLLVSPEHAMFLDGVLVGARNLVNGTTITQERGLTQVDYYHVELASHDILLAEGAPSESFVDDDSRDMFRNAAEWKRLSSGQERAPAAFCAPKVQNGPELEAIRRKLDLIADELPQAA